jgi:hypothetical protein
MNPRRRCPLRLLELHDCGNASIPMPENVAQGTPDSTEVNTWGGQGIGPHLLFSTSWVDWRRKDCLAESQPVSLLSRQIGVGHYVVDFRSDDVSKHLYGTGLGHPLGLVKDVREAAADPPRAALVDPDPSGVLQLCCQLS